MKAGSAVWIAKPLGCELQVAVYQNVHFFVVRVSLTKLVLNIFYYYHRDVAFGFSFNNTA